MLQLPRQNGDGWLTDIRVLIGHHITIQSPELIVLRCVHEICAVSIQVGTYQFKLLLTRRV